MTRRYLRGSITERLAAYSVLNPDTGCREWVACKNEHGYGLVSIGGKSRLAHRVAYEQHHGPIPEGMGVLHRCDNPACIEVPHLFLGTQHDNIVDMQNKGRQRYALASARSDSKITDEQVLAIRKDPRSYPEIAADYGVHRVFVGQIKRYERRAYVKEKTL